MRDGGVGIIPAYAGSTFVPAAGGEPGDGSSPHTRGARGLRGPLDGSAGIIPAYAGSTANLGGVVGVVEDHPRIRGEHRILPPDQTLPGGSSPHTRGALLLDRPLIHRGRIIPAYAGSTGGGWAWLTIGGGIIPAYAGSTGWAGTATPWESDHPRIRGEHRARRHEGASLLGSSPHTRGALEVGLVESRLRGIIPAYAGSTFRRLAALARVRDHPRIRGEHVAGVHGLEAGGGSSPHTRGAHAGPVGGRDRRGIIPAYAGSTGASVWARNRTWDHPRIRGEHRQPRGRVVVVEGSSPHTRGARSKTA